MMVLIYLAIAAVLLWFACPIELNDDDENE